ncbi:MAG: serine protease AprX [Acidobacteriota bacterium]|jgi:serine protease AprX|nr:serine protease AprX [Acidobacteriota bacterium]
MYKTKAGFRRANLAAACSRRGLYPMSRAGVNQSPKALKMFQPSTPDSLRRATALALVIILCALPASAGVRVQGTQGLTMTGADGIYYDNISGLTMTGADGLLAFQVNGIFNTTTNGLTMTGADGNRVANVDGVSYTGANSYAATHVNGLTMTGADGLTMTGADGLTMTGADGTTWQVASVVFRQPQGLTMTGADGLIMTGADGLTMTGADALTMTGADGLTMTGADSVRINGAAQVVATKTDGTIFYAPVNGLVMTGADGLTMTGADDVAMQGVNGLTMTGADGVAMLAADGLSMAGSTGLTMTGADGVTGKVGLMGLDPELALTLDHLTDDSNVNAAIVYHHPVTDADINDLKTIGIRGGTRFRELPVVVVTGTRCQLEKVSKLSAVRYISGNRTLQWNADNSRAQTGLLRMRQDADLQRLRGPATLQGNGITVAVLDTGLDSTHPDITGRVVRNVKLADLQGANPVDFIAPTNVESLNDTDQASGHGTFVGGIVAGSGASAGGKYTGYAPKAKLVGLSAGDYTLFNVLAGFDYLLTHPELGVRVVNCSFSANTVYDENDPVNVATRMLYARGVNVVFSAGNAGPGMGTLNPYAAAPWVISVGALDERGRLADYSSRGEFGSRTFRPTLAAPGTNVVSLRASGTNLTGTTALPADAQGLAATELPYYASASGTSFSAPQVVGTIALMLEADPTLSPARVRDILQRTATPLPPYYQHEVGAGALNTYAAVLQAAFPARQIGLFRAVMNRGQVRFVKDPSQIFKGTVFPGGSVEARLNVPADAVFASTDVAWGPIITMNDLALTTFDPEGRKAGESNYLNLPGLTGKRERTVADVPEAGTWRARVTHTLSAIATPQEFAGVFETAHVEYAPMADLAGLDAFTLDNIRRAVSALAMWPDADGLFRPAANVSRSELAEAMIVGARIPQYMPNTPSFLDVRDATTMNFAEGAQPLFPDAVRGSAFRPDDPATRLVAAVVLVRAAGLQSEADSKAGAYLGYTDASSIPWNLRGYVQVAVGRGLISSGQQFNPSGALTRAELARGVATILRMNIE